MPSLWTTALLVFAFFFAYYVYEPPYRGLYPDLLPDSVFGRAQGVQHVFRGIALGGGLIGGGFLFHLWQPAPFLVAAAIVVASRAPCPILLVTEDGGHGRVFEGVRDVRARSPGASSARTGTWRRSSSRTRPGRGRSPARGRSSSSTSRSAWASRS